MVTIGDEGICRFCKATISGRAMNKHLSSCKVRVEENEKESATGGKKGKIYHIKVWGYKPYWLHIEMKATSTLRELDSFLRDIWLECCGHLSQFKIDGVIYEVEKSTDSWFQIESESMDVQLNKVLTVKGKFEYEYDFGSTTYLKGEVISQREGILKETVKILSRNNPPEFRCEKCDGKATQICTDCGELYCERCLKKHGCSEEGALPVVNSPRMGVCGYCGESDYDEERK